MTMHPVRKKRLVIVVMIITAVSFATALTLYALKQNINLYYTPTQVADGKAPIGQICRVGGIVKDNSIIYGKKNLQISFVVTDTVHTVTVDYNGVLPDLFRAGQGIVVQGKFNKNGILIADQVLAKHGSDYMPPPAEAAIKAAQEQQKKVVLNK